MTTYLVFDAGIKAKQAAVTVDGGQTTTCDAAEHYDAVVHRFPSAPLGCPQVVRADEVTLDALRHAGRYDHLDTDPRCDALARSLAESTLPQYLAFDTPFFDELPTAARYSAIPVAITEKFELYRRGRHGLVHQRAAKPGRCISIVLAGDSSVAAIKDGKPLDISAGLTGLEGVPGDTTVGDIDPAAVLFLLEPLGLTLDEVELACRVEGGLKGVADPKNPDFAESLLCHRLRRHIGGMAAVLDGLDHIVFSGASQALVDRCTSTMAYLGVGSRVTPEITTWNPLNAAAAAVDEVIAGQ